MIEVKNLTKFYGANPALKDISFEVNPGEVLGFLGPNGAGKTTAMRIITCFIPATAGEVMVGGNDVFKDSIEVRKLIGYLPESVPLYLDLKVNEYLSFVAHAKGLSPAEAKDSIKQTVGECGLIGKERRLIRNLSKGFRQRVGLAQALIGNPKVLILDEPTVGLDPKQIVEIRDLIKELGRERTVILSTHILPEVSITCQRVLIINEGKIVAEDSPEELILKMQQSSRIMTTVRGEQNRIQEALSGVNEVTNVSLQQTLSSDTFTFIVESPKQKDVRADLAKCLVGGGFDLLELRSEDLTLEDIFIKLVTREEAEA